MDCLICLEPITGTPFQSAKRLTCSCKVPTHEHCFRQYRAAKGHTECIICHNREYERIGLPPPPPASDDDEEGAAELALFEEQLRQALRDERARREQRQRAPAEVQPNCCSDFYNIVRTGTILAAVFAACYLEVILKR